MARLAATFATHGSAWPRTRRHRTKARVRASWVTSSASPREPRIRYATRYTGPLSTTTTAAMVAPTASSSDRRVRYQYNGEGKLTLKTDAEGWRTQAAV